MITMTELQEMFGSNMPIEAAQLIHISSEQVSEDDLRRKLAEIAARPKPDDPATIVYGRLLHRHLHAAYDNDRPRRDKLFNLIETYRAEFPEECQIWEDRYAS